MASGTASSYPGVAQPGATSNRGSVVTVAVGSFNFGVNQNMLKQECWANRHRGNFRRVCVQMVLQGDLDIMFGCELGDKREGFSRASISVNDILEESFGDISCSVIDTYMALSGFQDSDVVLHGDPVKFTMTVDSRWVDAVITRFNVLRNDASDARQTVAHIVAGNVHTVCGGDSAPTRHQRKRVLQQLRVQLEAYDAPHPQVRVVRLIVGDDNLFTMEALQVLQQRTDADHSGRFIPRWEINKVTMWQ